MAPDPTDNRDFIGSIDRAVIGFGLAVIAFIPTQILSIFRPDKLWPMMSSDHPVGRTNYLLGPGIFFVFSTAVHSLILYRIIGDGSAMQMSKSVDSAVQGANLGQILLSMAPAFVIALILAVLVWVITRISLKDWTIQHSMKAAFYASSAIQWMIFPVEQAASIVGQMGSFPNIAAIVIFQSAYMVYWFWMVFRKFTSDEASKALTTAALIGLVWAVAMYLNYHGLKVIFSLA